MRTPRLRCEPAAPARLPLTRCNSISGAFSLQFFHPGRSPHAIDRHSGEHADPECGRREHRLLDSPAVASGVRNGGEPLRLVGRRRQSGGRVFDAFRISGGAGDRSRLAQSPCFGADPGPPARRLCRKSFPLSDWTPGSWHHVVAAWHARPGPSSSQLMLYLDGRACRCRRRPGAKRKAPAWFSIGYYWGAYADSAVDEVYVFRRVLTPAEVDCLFQLRGPLPHAANSGSGGR